MANHGQWSDEVLFFARSGGIEATLLRDALVLTPQRALGSEAPRPAPLVIRFPAASAEAPVGEAALPTQHHFLQGRLHEHVSHVPGFERVLYPEVAPGIDLLVRRDGELFAYDLHVEPGADLAALELRLEGAAAPRLGEGGVLVVDTAAGPVEQRIGAAWEIDPASGARHDVPSAFELRGVADGALRLGFRAPGRDPARAFVLDPSILFSTYVGGSTQDALQDMDVGPDGAVYLTSRTQSDAPLTPEAFDTDPVGVEAWVGKLSPDGSRLEWATYLGGGLTEDPYGVHLDSDGTVVVVGLTWSEDFPSTPGVLQPEHGSPIFSDVFISRLAPDGASLVWSTFYGGSGFEGMETSTLLPGGDVIAVGWPDAGTPPATPGAYDTQLDEGDQFVLRVSADGSQVVFQTYLLSMGAVVSDAASNLYLAGAVVHDDELIGTPGAFQEVPKPGSTEVEGVILKMDAMGSEILWATYLGGSDTDAVVAIALDAAGAVYVTGGSESQDFPVTAGAFDTILDSGFSHFVAKFLPNGGDLVWATFLESPGAAQVMRDIVIDSAGNAVVAGSTNGPDFPTTPDAFQPDHVNAGSTGDATLTKLDAFGETLEYSTYFGASGSETISRIGFDASHLLRLGVRTSSANYFTTRDAFDTNYGGSGDIGVSAWDLELLPWTVLGGGLAGTVDIPNLAGTGELVPGASTRLSIRGALPMANAWFVVGLQAIHAPFKGGTFVPAPTLLVPFTPDVNGAHDRSFPWIDVPAGIDFYIQAWIQDPGGLLGWSASNALQLVSR